MNKSKYLQKVTDECNQQRKVVSKKTLGSVILLAIIAVTAFIGIPLLDSRAASVGTMLAGIFGILCIVFFIKFLQLRGNVSDSILAKCEQEIQKNLSTNETVESFDEEIFHPAFGVYTLGVNEVRVGRTYVLFLRENPKGPSFQIIRTDNLGEFKVCYFDQTGGGADIGMDLKDRNGTFIRSIVGSDKETFYKFLNAMENVKNYAAGDENAVIDTSVGQDNSFVEEVKTGVAKADRRRSTKIGIFGVVMGVFLFIAGASSGVAFIYGGFALFVVSIGFIIFVNVKKK